MNQSIDFKALAAAIPRHVSTIVLIIIASLICYTGWQISRVTSVQPDAVYLQQKRAAAKSTKLRANPATLDKLKTLRPSGDTSIAVPAGKNNPFTFN